MFRVQEALNRINIEVVDKPVSLIMIDLLVSA